MKCFIENFNLICILYKKDKIIHLKNLEEHVIDKYPGLEYTGYFIYVISGTCIFVCNTFITYVLHMHVFLNRAAYTLYFPYPVNYGYSTI